MRIFPDGAKKQPADNFADTKRPGSRRLLAAKCVPGRNSNSHYLHGALKRNPGAVSLPKNGMIPGFFGGEISAGSQSKFAFSPGGSNKKTGGPAEKTRQGFGFLFSRRNLRRVAIQILFPLRGR